MCLVDKKDAPRNACCTMLFSFCGINFSWKGKRQRFEVEHERELNAFHMADRKLESQRNADGKIPVYVWRQELEEIQRSYQRTYEQYKPMRDDLIQKPAPERRLEFLHQSVLCLEGFEVGFDGSMPGLFVLDRCIDYLQLRLRLIKPGCQTVVSFLVFL